MDKKQPRKLRYDRRLSLPSLKCLHLYQCSISSIDQLFYLSIPNLLQLNLNNNQLQAMDGIGNLQKLMTGGCPYFFLATKIAEKTIWVKFG